MSPHFRVIEKERYADYGQRRPHTPPQEVVERVAEALWDWRKKCGDNPLHPDHYANAARKILEIAALAKPDEGEGLLADKAEFEVGFYPDGSGPKVVVRYDTTADKTGDCIWLETGYSGDRWLAFGADVAEEVIAAIRRSARAIDNTLTKKETKRTCSLCGETKPASEFSNMFDGSQCKECRKWP
jgi:hypothetical protein